METLKVIVKSITVSCPNRMTVEQLERDFKEIEGHAFPFRYLGFKSSDQMLREAMQDVVAVEGYGRNALVVPIFNSKSKCDHIAKLVTEQKSRKRRRNSNRKNSSTSGNNTRTRVKSSSTSIKGLKSKVQHMGSVQEEETTPEHCYHTELSKTKKGQENLDPNPAVLIKYFNNCSYDKGDKPRYAIDQMNKQRSHQKEVSAEIGKPLMISALNGNKISPIPYVCDKYNFETKKERFNIEIKSFQAQPKTIINKSTLKTSLHEKEKVTPSGYSGSKDTPLDDRLCKLEQKFSEWCKDESKNRNFSRENPFEFDVYDEPEKKNPTDLDEAIPENAFDSSIFIVDFPESTVKFGTKIKPCKMPSNIKVESIIPIYISEIHNPYRFWFHLSHENNELKKLMDCIRRFYSQMSYTSEFTMLCELIQPGQVCAAIFDGFWHRAEIISNFTVDDKVKVFFMDYGTVYDVDICDIKYLHSDFAKLPAFAHRGTLAEICPFGLHWSTTSSKEFLAMTINSLLYGKVCEIDSKNNVYYLTICVTHSDKLVQINRKLIEKNCAVKSIDWSRSNRLGVPRMRHQREEYPTFDMLEKGEYPTLFEIKQMEDMGVSYESITDKMIFYPHILNFDKNMPKHIKNLPFYLLSNNPFASDIINEYSKYEESNL